MKAIDVETGLDEFFKAQGSSEAQRGDAIAVLKSQCGMAGEDVILKATGEALDSDASRAWIEANKPHLLPPKFEVSLADRAFAENNLTARGELVKQIGKVEADKIARSYGLKSTADPRRGTAPAREDDASKKKAGNGHDRAANPFSREGWNVSRQGSLLRAVGLEKCAAIAAAVGSRIGSTKPNPNF